MTASDESDEIRDLVLATEGSGAEIDGHEVTAAPSDADQNETARIVTEAIEAGTSPQEFEANSQRWAESPPIVPQGTNLGGAGRGT